MVPADFPDGSPSNAERRVFAALRDSPIEGTAFHSLNLPEHEYKLTAELDFVLVLDEIVLALEVKGGRVAQVGGMWTYTDRFDKAHHSHEGPFKQVTTGMHSLRQRVRDRSTDLHDVAFGTLVITPDVDLPSSAEWAEESFAGRGPMSRPGGLDDAIRRAVRYWVARQPQKSIAGATRKLLLNFLRPDFDRIPNLAAVAGSLDLEYSRMTEEQASRLDILMENDRVLCQGGAGTGKTFLAIETARRHANGGRSTLLVCRSETFAQFLSTKLTDVPVDVSPISSLPTKKKYDQIVVDEGQDLADYELVQRLEESLLGGLENGNWAIFLDPNRQSRLYGDHDPEALQYLGSAATSKAALRQNCRNTRAIAFTTRAATGADLGVASAGAGPTVTTVEVDGAESEKRLLEAWLRQLRDEDVDPSQITIVSHSQDWQGSVASSLKAARQNRIRVIDEHTIGEWPFREMSWATAVDVKGLENQFVAVVDLDSLTSEEAIDRLYVALSRPRAGLWLAVSAEAQPRFTELLNQNLSLAVQAYGGSA